MSKTQKQHDAELVEGVIEDIVDQMELWQENEVTVKEFSQNLRKEITPILQSTREHNDTLWRERVGWKGYAVVDPETDNYLYSDFFVNRKDAVKYLKNELAGGSKGPRS